MPTRLQKRIRELLKYAILDLVTFLIMILFIALEVEACILEGSANFHICFCGMICIAAFTMFVSFLKKRKQNEKQIYKIPIAASESYTLIEKFAGELICEDIYIAFITFNKIKLRILIQFIPVFNHKVAANQRKQANSLINKRYKIKQEISTFEAAKMARVNLVFTDKKTPELKKWLEQGTEKMLSRNESIINAAIVKSENLLLLPDCTHGPSYSEIRRYKAAIELLCSTLSN